MWLIIKNTVEYKYLYNHDMSGIGITTTPAVPDLEMDITKEHIKYYVKDAANSAIDLFLCCPTLLRIPLWHSKICPVWDDGTAANFIIPENGKERNPSQDYFPRVRKYIFNGGNPVQDTYEAVRENGMGFFFSYRLNDWHFVNETDYANYPSLDPFLVEHPEYRIGPYKAPNPVGWDICYNLQDYRHKEVREHYLGLIHELFENWDADGLELDFMRSPCFFPLDDIVNGTAVMTGFVREVRAMLDKFGEKRNKYLPLCIRVPHRYEYCASIGLDVAGWDKAGIIDMINISPSYALTMNIDIEGFKANTSNSRIYGELESVLYYNTNRVGYQAERRTTKEMYETVALDLLKRGADGLSFFNFGFTREVMVANSDPLHEYAEPPVETLKNLNNIDYLISCPKHFFIYGVSSIDIMVYDDVSDGHIKGGRLRVISDSKDFLNTPLYVYCNDIQLEEVKDDNLFPTNLRQGVLNAHSFTVKTEMLRHGKNNFYVKPNNENSEIKVLCMEFAIYIK